MVTAIVIVAGQLYVVSAATQAELIRRVKELRAEGK
jgi:hypothetical protein